MQMPETRRRGQEGRKEGPREVQGRERKNKHESPAATMLFVGVAIWSGLGKYQNVAGWEEEYLRKE